MMGPCDQVKSLGIHMGASIFEHLISGHIQSWGTRVLAFGKIIQAKLGH